MAKAQAATSHYSLRLAAEERDALEYLADLQGRSMAQVIKLAIREYIDDPDGDHRRDAAITGFLAGMKHEPGSEQRAAERQAYADALEKARQLEAQSRREGIVRMRRMQQADAAERAGVPVCPDCGDSGERVDPAARRLDFCTCPAGVALKEDLEATPSDFTDQIRKEAQQERRMQAQQAQESQS